MTSHNRLLPRRSDRVLTLSGSPVIVGAVIVATALAGILVGCEEEAPPPPVARKAAAPPPPAPPPAPKVTPVADLMAQYSIDERLALPEDKAPDNDEDRVAVLSFFDAFVRGDEQALQPMMTLLDRLELDALVEDGAWRDTAEQIVAVDLETGAGPYGEKCALALFEVGTEMQPQLWYYTSDGGDYEFEAVATPPHIMEKLHGTDWIALWHDILQEELALADEVEVEVETGSVNLDDSGETSGAGGGPAPGGSPRTPRPTPGGPGNPDRRKPPPPRKPPGAR